MDNLNIEFLEAYKRLEKLCKEIYESEKGVTSYIDNMKETPSDESRFVANWQNDLNMLMDLRCTRNLLTHEEGTMNRCMCDADDIQWLNDFTARILKQDDPISRLSLQRRRLSDEEFDNYWLKPVPQFESKGESYSFETDVKQKNSSSMLRFLAIAFSVFSIFVALLLVTILMLVLFG